MSDAGSLKPSNSLKREFPILEFDPTREAVIDPAKCLRKTDIASNCVACFFPEVIEKLRALETTREFPDLKSELGPHPLIEIDAQGKRLAVFHPGVGAPLAAALLEEVIALGCAKFIACGGAGVLNKEIASGHIVVATSAVRDEGTSYHYLPPGREAYASPEAVGAIRAVLEKHKCPYTLGKTWTTDAFYRETPAKVALRRSEGCLAVEMEAAAFFAVAEFRRVTFAQMLYGGDDVSGIEWDPRRWDERLSVREQLFWLAAEACLRL